MDILIGLLWMVGIGLLVLITMLMVLIILLALIDTKRIIEHADVTDKNTYRKAYSNAALPPQLWFISDGKNAPAWQIVPFFNDDPVMLEKVNELALMPHSRRSTALNSAKLICHSKSELSTVILCYMLNAKFRGNQTKWDEVKGLAHFEMISDLPKHGHSLLVPDPSTHALFTYLRSDSFIKAVMSNIKYSTLYFTRIICWFYRMIRRKSK